MNFAGENVKKRDNFNMQTFGMPCSHARKYRMRHAFRDLQTCVLPVWGWGVCGWGDFVFAEGIETFTALFCGFFRGSLGIFGNDMK